MGHQALAVARSNMAFNENVDIFCLDRYLQRGNPRGSP